MSRPRLLLIPVAAIALIAIGFLVAQFIPKPGDNPVPDEILNELQFTPLVIPVSTKDITTSHYALGPADESGKPLSFQAHLYDYTIHISETQLPPQFEEIPDYKQRFIDAFIIASETVSTGAGTIYYGSPAKSEGHSQAGLLLDRGVMTIFSLETGKLNQREWRMLGDALVVAR